MNSGTGNISRKILCAGVRIFAAIGVGATLFFAYWYLGLPRRFAAPNSFVMVDVYKSASYDGSMTRIYLEAPSSSKDLRFEGGALTHQLAEKPHPQSSIPLQAVNVSGKGNIVFGSVVFTVDNGLISINGRDVCPSEITVTRRGDFRDGPIYIAK